MGQKANPIALRLGITRTWDSVWFPGIRSDYAKQLHEDLAIRRMLGNDLKQAAVGRVIIERTRGRCKVSIHSARPGVVVGKKGAEIDALRTRIARITNTEVIINIVEIRKPELDATLVAESIAQQLERRVAFRRAMKRAIDSAMRLGAVGIRINCSGRLGGAEIARREWYRQGRVPLQTLRADIDYGVATAFTTFGTCGVKVWICKGEVLERGPKEHGLQAADDRVRTGGGRSSGNPLAKAEVIPINRPRLDATSNNPIFTPTGDAPNNSTAKSGARQEEEARQTASLQRDEALLPGWEDEAEREFMKAFRQLSSNSAARKNAVAALLKHARISMKAKSVPRSLTKRIGAVMPTLFESLFDPAAEVRWTAAYAIAALRDPEHFDERPPEKPTSETKNAVLQELQRYLKERGSSLISEVEISHLDRTAEQIDVDGNVKIFDHVPLEIGDSRLRLSTERRKVEPHLLELELSDSSGRVIKTYEQKAERAKDALSPLAQCAFRVKIKRSELDTLRVGILLDQRRLRTHVVSLDEISVKDDQPATDLQPA
ncbi:ribosomal protein S3 [Bradyrhizobium sp. cir1]|nr:ribosomal protein S3 [Bradyrhizobium sp. cir1]